MTRRREQTCTCCGGYAGRWRQWWNQDTGFAVCESCLDFVGKGMREDQFRLNYGEPEVHYARLPATLVPVSHG